TILLDSTPKLPRSLLAGSRFVVCTVSAGRVSTLFSVRIRGNSFLVAVPRSLETIVSASRLGDCVLRVFRMGPRTLAIVDGT
ncbi:hypothetical protein PENTCL1PPCAC_30543, partial [Pristionchus entomophagus]